jgi:hypothetical protein
MTIYNNLVLTIKGNYRLWDKDFINNIDLTYTESYLVWAILTKSQKNDLYDGVSSKIILSDYQIEVLTADHLFKLNLED